MHNFTLETNQLDEETFMNGDLKVTGMTDKKIELSNGEKYSWVDIDEMIGIIKNSVLEYQDSAAIEFVQSLGKK